ncbi:sigma 54-interacting transcriptional regulator [Maridesulfovibrio sp.]|uniref:sigma-54 interaction domain-containing protein n=1 Tax=Maridesulfovibrio sp. TaxID=2795000 RepID=UPI0029CA0D4D|nr:sigma 54-interacting transcriptional regulator [Maridesulfovibrio sp.]
MAFSNHSELEIIDVLNRIDAARNIDINRIVTVVLRAAVELVQPSSAAFKIVFFNDDSDVYAFLNSNKQDIDFLDLEADFSEKILAFQDSFQSECTDEKFSFALVVDSPQAPKYERILQYVIDRCASAISFLLLNQKLQKNTNEVYRLRLNLENSFNSIPDAIVTVAEDMSILSANAAFLSLYGGILADYKGRTLDQCFGHNAGPYNSVIRQTLELGRITSHFRVNTKIPDGKECKLELNAAPLRTGEHTFGGVVLVIKDMTRLAVLEQQLEDRRLLNNMVGQSDAMKRVATLVHSLSDIATTVLITGESGTGKELIADALHYTGGRAEKRIVKVNCAALSESLLESELFGHVRGAFTGASREAEGRVAAAEGGTLFLDEIGDLPLAIQLKLLRFLEYKEYERVGSSKPRKANVRVVTATNANLVQKVKDGSFRKDLYYRLNVFQIELPPLRERREDIPLLAESFMNTFNNELGRSIKAISPEFMDALVMYDWPGNIRELRHCIEYAAILCLDEVLQPIHLPQNFRNNFNLFCDNSDVKQVARHEAVAPVGTSEPSSKKHAFDKQKVLEALEQAEWKKARAARILGISRPTLYRWMKRAGIVEV